MMNRSGCRQLLQASFQGFSSTLFTFGPTGTGKTHTMLGPPRAPLEDEGLVRAEASGTGRVFQLTDQGRRYVEEHREEVAAPWEVSGPPEGHDDVQELFGLVRHIAGATMQIMHAGSSPQLAEARKLLQQTRRGLYRILADGDEEEGDE